MLDSAFLIAIIIFLITFLLSLKNLSYGFLLFMALSPLVHKEVFSLGVWDLLPVRVAAVGVAFAAAIYLIKWYRKTEDAKRSSEIREFVNRDPFLVLLVLLWVTRAISILGSSVLSYSLRLFLFYSVVILMYVVFKSLVAKYGGKFLDKVVYLYLLLGFATGVFALIQYWLRACCRKTVGSVWVVPGFTPRLGSTFWDVNHYGGFLITLIPIYFALIFKSKLLYKKVLFGIGAIFMVLLLFMTQSRSAWIGLGLGVVISAVIYYGNRLKKPLQFSLIAIVFGISTVLVYTTFTGISVRDRVARFMHYRLDSTDTHMMLLEGAAEVFLDNVAIGSGYGNFDEAFRSTETASDYFDREPRLREMKVPPHSVWGEVLAETGGIGIILYALFAISIFASLVVAVFENRNKPTKYLGVGLLGSLVSILAAGLFYSYNLEFYWIVLFLSIGYAFVSFKEKWSFEHVIKWWYGKRVTPYLIIAPPALFYIFIKLGSTTLVDWDEAIYAKVAKNIVLTGEWLSLRWDDMNKYWFEKPPLYMWMTAVVFKIVNFNSFGARFVSAFFGFLGILLTYKFGEKLYNKLTGILASLILLSTVHYLYYSRNGMLDVTVTFFITATLCLFYLGMNKRKETWYFALAGAMLGLGVMTKAVIGLLPIPIILLYLVCNYRSFSQPQGLRKAWFSRRLGVFFISFLVVALPWHVYSIAVHGSSFWNKYFIDHILGRGLSGFGHEKPFWWFLEVIKVSFRIWIFPLVAGILILPGLDKKKRDELVFLSVSIIFVLVFFSVSKDKLQWYIMPIYPFLAIVSARFIERLIVFLNSSLRSDVKVDYKVARVVVVFAVFLVAVFHVILVRDRVYYPDFNKDKVALVKIHNNLYPIEDHPDRKLYYHGIAPPVLLFYSDHRIKHTDEDHMLKTIDEAAPNQSYTFLIREGMYYGVKGEQGRISAPLVLDVKGAAGEWILVKSKSRVELLNEEFALLVSERSALEQKDLLGTITLEEKVRLQEVQKRFNEIVAKLTEYGYPPF